MGHDRQMVSTETRGKTWLTAGAGRFALLSVAEMYEADRVAVAAGIAGTGLMEAAGAAVAEQVALRWTPRPVTVLCGPGNNGGDGFVAAQRLADAGWSVRVALLGAREKLKGDAAWAAAQWSGPVGPLSADAISGAGLVIDALFGAGLDRAVHGQALAAIEAVARSGIPVAAVDIPSGVSGDTGAVLGVAVAAEITVTFFRKKPGHLLLPGRSRCGDTIVADIGIPEAALDGIAPRTAENAPVLWSSMLPVPKATDHKYSRGHVAVIAGEMSGAARLAAQAAARIGAGMVTVLAPPETLPAYAALPAAVIVGARPKPAALGEWLRARRVSAVLIGPGLGRSTEARAFANACVASGLALVLDADALTAFGENAASLARRRRAATVFTPHSGEFERVFGAGAGDRLTRARVAAAESGAVIVAKANDTVVAEPGGRAIINANAPAWLATAGTGDVLAGMVLGLVAQGMPAFEGAATAVWLHGQRAAERGQNLIADDLVNAAFTFPA